LIAVYLRVLEALRLKEGERAAAGWQENPDAGTVTIQDVTKEFDVALEDADFTTLHQLANQWSGWPTAPESLRSWPSWTRPGRRTDAKGQTQQPPRSFQAGRSCICPNPLHRLSNSPDRQTTQCVVKSCATAITLQGKGV